nr:autotransporter outer membrane beta-barrel domain-containing protein [Desulfobulbaceae bacterium]
MTVAGNITGAGNLGLSLSSSTSGYIVNSTNTAGYAPGAAVTVSPTLTTSIADGSKYALIRGKVGNAPTLASITAPSSGLLSWTVTDGTAYAGSTDINGYSIIAEDVVMVATLQEAASLAGVSENTSASVDAAASYTGDNAQLKEISRTVQNLSTADEVNKAAVELSPDVTRGVIEGSNNAVIGTLKTISTRSDIIRLASRNVITGVNAGDATKKAGLWGQFLGHYSDQEQHDGFDGYVAESSGIVFGIDTQVSDQVRLGAALSYTNSRVSLSGINSDDKTDIDSYQSTVYGSYIGHPHYVDWSVSYTNHQYDTRRLISYTGFSDTATGDHDGHQFTVDVNGGYPLEFKELIVTPVAGLTYSMLQQQDYMESSQNGSALSVDDRTDYSLKSSLGVRVSKTFESDKFMFTPEFSTIWQYEFENDPSLTTASYVAGGSSFTSRSVGVSSNAFIPGLALTFETKDNLTIRLKYSGETRKHYLGHNAMAEVRLAF